MPNIDEALKTEAGLSLSYELEIGLFRNDLMHKNRFFSESYFFECTKGYVEKAINNIAGPLDKVTLSPDQLLYRARIKNKHVSRYITDYGRYEDIVGEPEKSDKQFYGLSAEESLAPKPDDTINGRLNPQYIQMLYTSNQPSTALVEIRPIINTHVSIATIKVKEPLNILRINSDITFSNDPDDNFLYFINRLFTTPLDGTFEDYLPVQFISGYIKSTKEFDGIEFQSSLDKRGRNIVIFNQDKCEVVGSKLYLVNSIELRADCLAPYDGSKLNSKI